MVGGYDEARINGDIYNFTTSAHYSLGVNVAAISYQDGNHSTILLDPSEGPFTARLDAAFNFLQLSPLVFDRFTAASNGQYNSSSGNVNYPRNVPPTGSLSITMSNGHVTVIPASELFALSRAWSDEGELIIDDDAYFLAEVQKSSLEPEDSIPPILGIPFMTMNYIIVDYERGIFQMATANRSMFSENKALRPISVCRPAKSISPTYSGIPSATGKPTAIHTPKASPSAISFAPRLFKETTILSVLIGMGLGAGIVALAALLVLREYHRKAKRVAQEWRQLGPLQPPMSGRVEINEIELEPQKVGLD